MEIAHQSAVAGATQVLSDPALITACVGSRKKHARSLTSFLVAICLGASAVYGALDLAYQQSLFHEISTLVNDTVPIAPSPVRAIDPAPLHPILQVGQDDNGLLSLPRLVSAWAHAGLDQRGAQAMLVAMYGRGALFQATGDDMASFQYNQAMTPAQLTAMFRALGADPARLAKPPEDFTVPAWTPAVYETWSGLIREEGLDEGLVDHDRQVDPAYARQQIMRAIDQAGLASLRLPLSAHASPNRMLAYARAIDQANLVLGTQTGWGGQALGLAGRVHLELHPRSAGVDGETWVDNGKVMISGNWPSISHEWLHAVDFTLADHAFKRPSYNATSSEQLGILRQKAGDGDIARTHASLLDAVGQADPGWVSNIKTLDKARNQPYFSTPSEMLSRSFEVFVLDQEGKSFSAVSIDRQNPAAYPTSAAMGQQAIAWKAWFASIKPLGLTTPRPGFADTLRQHRQGHTTAKAATSATSAAS